MGISYSKFFTALILGLALGISGCQKKNETKAATPQSVQRSVSTDVKFDKFTLPNGLQVVLHEDHSDPIVAIDLAVHVGSARELPHRTGFAHLFEHLLFLDSENLGYGGLDEMNTRIGGEGTNGFTTNDMTQYFQAVPKDGLEKIIWAEADKIGWFIKTVNQPVIDNERQVVKNEKRQRVDNQPYGHRWSIVGETLYPEDHPYNWQVIGSLADLDAATLKDVQNFYKKWYVPNNVTVTLSGDFDPAEAKAMITKYFGEIPRGDAVKTMAPRPSTLKQTKSLYYEDNFATVPELGLVWPTVEQYNKDAYALDILASYLGDGKKAPFNQVMIDEDKVTTDISIFTNHNELAGEFYILIDAQGGKDIDGLMPSVEKAFARFETTGIPQDDLDMLKTKAEIDFYDNLQSALGKAIQLGQYNTFTGDPGFINTDLKNIQSVTREDVMRVYQKYIKDRPHVITSIVPKGQADLAKEGAVLAPIVEEKIVQGAEKEIVINHSKRDFTPTPSSFDRTKEPPFGPAFDLPAPKVWHETEKNGLRVYGIENDEIPLVYFNLTIDAGTNRGQVSKPAVASLTTDMLLRGTRDKDRAAFEDAMSLIGADIDVGTGQDGMEISGSVLARNFDKAMSLVEEMILQPRWDVEEFSLLKNEVSNYLTAGAGDPNELSGRLWPTVLYPQTHPYHYTNAGTKDKLEAVSLDDLKAFHEANYTPVGAYLLVAGAIDMPKVKQAIADLTKNWTGEANPAVHLANAKTPEHAQLYFYDVPGAKQSVLLMGMPALSGTDADLPKAKAVNFLLGGIYTSKLNTELRVNKGYTYGIQSGFNTIKDRGTFTVSTSVRSNVTLDSLNLIRDILKSYGPEFTDADLKTMKSALIKGQALSTETLGAKLGMLSKIADYGWAEDYMRKNAAMIRKMSLEDFKAIAQKYIDPDRFYYLIVGDGKTQYARLNNLGLGEPVKLNKDATHK